MDDDEIKEEIAHNRVLIKEYNKHLKVLELQAAKFGLHIPSYIQVEIDELNKNIQECKRLIHDHERQLLSTDVISVETNNIINETIESVDTNLRRDMPVNLALLFISVFLFVNSNYFVQSASFILGTAFALFGGVNTISQIIKSRKDWRRYLTYDKGGRRVVNILIGLFISASLYYGLSTYGSSATWLRIVELISLFFASIFFFVILVNLLFDFILRRN